jgi:hypothetical protein
MTTPQANAYNRYQAGETAASKQQLHDSSVVSQQFVDFMSHVSDQQNVDTSNLGTTKYAKLVFFESLMSGTFHTHWGNYTPPPQGSGSTLLVQFRQTENGYKVIYAGFDAVKEYDLENPEYWVLNSNSFECREGLVSFNVKRLSTLYNGVNLWVHELMANGSLVARYYLLPYAEKTL